MRVINVHKNTQGKAHSTVCAQCTAVEKYLSFLLTRCAFRMLDA